jgi:hypothetical protein
MSKFGNTAKIRTVEHNESKSNEFRDRTKKKLEIRRNNFSSK